MDLHEPTSASDDDAAARTAAWAERMRTKRQAAKARIAADARTATGQADPEPTPGYWSTDALFTDSRMAEEADLSRRPDPVVVSELLAVLDLRDDADADALTLAYRRLAKIHHPDRFAGADEDTQAHHAERMLEINRAYQHLRTILHD